MELEFRMLAVDPAVQGSGVGRAVVRQVIEHAQSLPGIDGDQHHQCDVYGTGPWPLRIPRLQAGSGAGARYMPGEDVLLWVFRLEVSRASTGSRRNISQ